MKANFIAIWNALTKLSFPRELERVAGIQDFFLCQVGANDGRTNDPVNKFIRSHKPRALLIEPQPETFKLLEEEYPKSEFPQISLLQIAVGKGSEHGGHEATLWKISDNFVPEYLKNYKSWANPSGISSFSRNHVRDFLLKVIPSLESDNRVDDVIDHIQVPQRSLAKILAEEKVSFVSTLQVDAEGFDGEVVNQTLDLVDDGVIPKPHLIHFEAKNLGGEEITRLVRRLRLHGYLVVPARGGNALAVVNPSLSRHVWFGLILPLLVRRYPIHPWGIRPRAFVVFNAPAEHH